MLCDCARVELIKKLLPLRARSLEKEEGGSLNQTQSVYWTAFVLIFPEFLATRGMLFVQCLVARKAISSLKGKGSTWMTSDCARGLRSGLSLQLLAQISAELRQGCLCKTALTTLHTMEDQNSPSPHSERGRARPAGRPEITIFSILKPLLM